MKVAFFSTKPYDQASFLDAGAGHDHELAFLEPRLTPATAALARGADAVCAFVNDELDEAVLSQLTDGGTRLVALRCTGFNHVDLLAAARLGLTVAHVPAYSPYAVAEHTVALLLTLNRKIHRAYTRVREGNFALHGLLGFDLHGRTVGVVGTGAIGTVLARILAGFGCRVLAFDPSPNEDCRRLGVSYVALHELFAGSDVVSLHCPLTPDTYHLLDDEAVAAMPDGVMIVNTSRGALVDTTAVIAGLKSGKIGSLALDVYEEEAHLFFEDRSDLVITDDLFSRLLTFPNVLITGHQAFFTAEALSQIARTTLGNLTAFARGGDGLHAVVRPAARRDD